MLARLLVVVALTLCLCTLSVEGHASYLRAQMGSLDAAGALPGPITPPLTPDELNKLIERRVTCPFVGSAVKEGSLKVLGTRAQPVASVAEIIKLGNTAGGSNLGQILELNAGTLHTLGHALGATAGDLNKKMTAAIPAGTFSLDFPGSFQAHPGHSGILMGNPRHVNSGKLNMDNLNRLLKFADPAKQCVSTTNIGNFVGDNLLNDENVFFAEPITGLEAIVTAHIASKGPNIVKHAEAMTPATDADRAAFAAFGEPLVVGASAEWAEMVTIVSNQPGVPLVNGEICVQVNFLRDFFVDHKFPAFWEFWKKPASAWFTAISKIAPTAAKRYAAGWPALRDARLKRKTEVERRLKAIFKK